MEQRRLQGGSLGGFIIVAVLLGLVLVGGLYGLQRYNSGDRPQVAGNQSEEAGRNQQNGDDDKTPAKDEVAGDETASPDWGESEDKTPSGAGEETPATTEDEAAGSEELPATGPTDNLLTGLALAGVTYLAATSLRSRHWTSREE